MRGNKKKMLAFELNKMVAYSRQRTIIHLCQQSKGVWKEVQNLNLVLIKSDKCYWHPEIILKLWKALSRHWKNSIEPCVGDIFVQGEQSFTWHSIIDFG